MRMTVKSGVRVLLASFILVACTADSGSERWCENLKDKPKVEWTAEEVKVFTNYCIGQSPE